MNQFEELLKDDDLIEVVDVLEIYLIDENDNVNVVTLTNAPNILDLKVYPYYPINKKE